MTINEVTDTLVEIRDILAKIHDIRVGKINAGLSLIEMAAIRDCTSRLNRAIAWTNTQAEYRAVPQETPYEDDEAD